MIRPIVDADAPALDALLGAVGLFSDPELKMLSQLFGEALAAGPEGEHRWIVDDDGGPVAVAYYAPERMTDGTWNLYLLAVHPGQRRRGRAGALIGAVVDDLRRRGARLLIVETASVPELAPARALYEKAGFERDAVVRDFYAAGVDKRIYRRALDA